LIQPEKIVEYISPPGAKEADLLLGRYSKSGRAEKKHTSSGCYLLSGSVGSRAKNHHGGGGGGGKKKRGSLSAGKGKDAIALK